MDEQARIFQQERRALGLSVEDYLRVLLHEREDGPELLHRLLEKESSLQFTGCVWRPFIRWGDLKHAHLWDDLGLEFEAVSYGPHRIMLVQPMVLIDEITDTFNLPASAITPLIEELQTLQSNTGIYIGFEG